MKKDDELIEQMKAKVFPRIQDLMSQRYKEDIESPEFAQMCIDEGVTDPPEAVQLPLSAEDLEIVKESLGTSLTTVAVHLLWVVAAMADEGVFISSKRSVAVAATLVDLHDLVRGTSIKNPADISFVVQQMAESLEEVVRSHVAITVLINCKPFELRAE